MPDSKALQGTWTIVSMEIDGQRIGDPASAQVIVKRDRFTTSSMGAVYEGRLELDAAASPKQFNLVFTKGPEKGNINRGIYELSGDTWRICLNTTGGDRPTAFATASGSGLALETLQRGAAAKIRDGRAKAAKTGDERAKAAKTGDGRAKTAASAVPAPEGEPAPELAGDWCMGSCIIDGRPLETEFLGFGKRKATATEVTVTMGPQVMVSAAYRVDRSATPCHMNYVLAHGPNRGKVQHGIYRLEDGKLTTCFAPTGQERPAEFSSSAGDGRTLTVWQTDAN